MASLAAQRHLAAADRSVAKGARRLASGLRIDTAADDAAGSAMADRLRAKVRSVEQSRRNANDGISLVHAAEATLQEATDMMHRLRELAVQSQSATIGAGERSAIGAEFGELVAEVTRVSASATFGGVSLFGSTPGKVDLQVGPGTSPLDVVSVPVQPLHVDLVFPADPWTAESGESGDPNLLEQIDELLESITAMRSRFGALENRLTHVVALLSRSAEDGSASLSRVADLDVAAATAAFARDRIAHSAGVAVLSQANLQPALALRLLQS